MELIPTQAVSHFPDQSSEFSGRFAIGMFRGLKSFCRFHVQFTESFSTPSTPPCRGGESPI